MPATTPPARYDLPWKAALTHAFRAFMAFFFGELCVQIDWSKRPRFRDKELAGIMLGDAPDWRPNAFHNQLLGTKMGISFATAKLLDYASREDLESSQNPFALVTLAHLRTQQAHHDPDRLYAAKWHLTKLLYQHRWSKARIITMFKVIHWMMALPETQQKHFWQAAAQLKKERKMTDPMKWITPLEEMFIDEGMQKGAAAILERQLTRRFGPVSKTTQKKLAKASLAQLTAWSDAVLDATSLTQVFKTQSAAGLSSSGR